MGVGVGVGVFEGGRQGGSNGLLGEEEGFWKVLGRCADSV